MMSPQLEAGPEIIPIILCLNPYIGSLWMRHELRESADSSESKVLRTEVWRSYCLNFGS